MQYTELDGIRKKASRLVYGTTAAASNGERGKAFREYDLAFEKGFRIYDTAHAYGNGEDTLGRWLEKSGHREEVLILDKGCNPNTLYTEPDDFSADTIRRQVEESLKKLRTDHVEFYILHRDDPKKGVEEIVDVLNALYREGKILRFGGSNWTMERTLKANAYAKESGQVGFTVCSPNYTYARLIRDPWGGSVTLTGEENAPFRAYLAETGMPVFNYSSLARGFLSGKYKADNRIPAEKCLGEGTIREYFAAENIERLERAEKLASELNVSVPQIAMAWLMKQPMNLFPLTAPSDAGHMDEVIGALELDLSDEQLTFLDRPTGRNE